MLGTAFRLPRNEPLRETTGTALDGGRRTALPSRDICSSGLPPRAPWRSLRDPCADGAEGQERQQGEGEGEGRS
eukprot:14418339-Alexandrium_andersonii.AAC.1